MTIALITDLKCSAHATRSHHCTKYVQALDQNRQIDLDADTFLFH